MSWWAEDILFYADYDYDNERAAGVITFPSSVTIKTTGGDLCYDSGLNISQWARENGKPFYKKGLAFKRIDLPMEVDVLNYDDLVPENEGKVYKRNGKFWVINKYINSATLYFQELMDVPGELFYLNDDDEPPVPGEYDVTNYAFVRVRPY